MLCQDLEVKVVGAAVPDAWEYDLAMDGEEWDLAVEEYTPYTWPAG